MERVIYVGLKDGRSCYYLNDSIIGNIDHIVIQNTSTKRVRKKYKDISKYWLNNKGSHAVWGWREAELMKVIRFLGCFDFKDHPILNWDACRSLPVIDVNCDFYQEVAVMASTGYYYIPFYRLPLLMDYYFDELGRMVVALRSSRGAFGDGRWKYFAVFDVIDKQNLKSVMARLSMTLTQGYLGVDADYEDYRCDAF